MTFGEAKRHRLSFGKYSGLTLDVVAETDAGLKYLDWLTETKHTEQGLDEALEVYLSDPTIASDLGKILAGEEPEEEDEE